MAVIQRDINIEFLDVILNKDNKGDFLERIADRLSKRRLSGEKEDYSKLINALEEIPHVSEKLDGAKEVLRGEGFYDSNKYMESLGIIGKWLSLISTAYFPS